jgi:hypothetical protein
LAKTIVGYLFEHDVKFGTFFTILKKTIGDHKPSKALLFSIFTSWQEFAGNLKH